MRSPFKIRRTQALTRRRILGRIPVASIAILPLLYSPIMAQDSKFELRTDGGLGWQGKMEVTLPPQGGIENGTRVLEAFAGDPQWGTSFDLNEEGDPLALKIQVPSPFASDQSITDVKTRVSGMPRHPLWYIYRFKYLEFEDSISKVLPFHYLEVDWNTEGLPRGPNGSFIRPHFDFHFYVKSRDYVRSEMTCSSLGKTCDERRTRYDQLRRFMTFAEPCFLPEGYFPDLDSAIPEMGLHFLDGAFEFFEENVNKHPVVIYGTFDGELAFLESSFTLTAFRDAINASETGDRLQWPIPQPARSPFKWWPKTISLSFIPASDMFLLALEDFERYEPANDCD